MQMTEVACRRRGRTNSILTRWSLSFERTCCCLLLMMNQWSARLAELQLETGIMRDL